MWFFKLKGLGFRVLGDVGVHATLHSQGLKVFILRASVHLCKLLKMVLLVFR